MESNTIDNAICLNTKTGVYNRVRTMITGPEGTTIMFQDGSAVSFAEFSQDWIVDSEMTDEEFKEVSQLNVFNISNSNSLAQKEEFDMDILTKPIKSKSNNSIKEKPKVEPQPVTQSDSQPEVKPEVKSVLVNNTINDLFSRLPDDVKVNCTGFELSNFPVEFIRDFIKYFNINKDELADGLLNKYKEQFKSIIIEYVCKENKD